MESFMKARDTVLFLALLTARFAGAEPAPLPGALPSPAPVWTPPPVATSPVETGTGHKAEPADKLLAGTPTAAPEAGSTQEKKNAGNAANQQDAQATPSPVAAVAPAERSDLLSTLANRQDRAVTLTIDEAAGVEM